MLDGRERTDDARGHADPDGDSHPYPDSVGIAVPDLESDRVTFVVLGFAISDREHRYLRRPV